MLLCVFVWPNNLFSATLILITALLGLELARKASCTCARGIKTLNFLSVTEASTVWETLRCLSVLSVGSQLYETKGRALILVSSASVTASQQRMEARDLSWPWLPWKLWQPLPQRPRVWPPAQNTLLQEVLKGCVCINVCVCVCVWVRACCVWRNPKEREGNQIEREGSGREAAPYLFSWSLVV